MAATYEPVGQLLTGDEYDALPANPRRELVDGVVHVMASPSPLHQDVALDLRNQLRRLCPGDLRVTGEVEVRLSDDLRRNPDVMVVRASGYDRRVPRLLPVQVVLGVEIVSPGSESADRIHKPLEYAAAGIEHYWRVELGSGIVVNTHRLADTGEYVHTGVFTPGDVVHASGLGWATVDVAALGVEG
jgi:Uma2 family endonuclease